MHSGWLVCALSVLAGCVEAQLVPCADGRTPAGARPLALQLTGFDPYSLGYDRARAVVVAITGGYFPCCNEPVPARTWEWTGAAWTEFAPRPAPAAQQRLVFDGARGQLLAVGGTTLYELAPDRWAQTLSPGPGYVLVERLRAGGVLLAPLTDPLVPAWLREGDVWRTTPWERVAWLGSSALAVEREDGTTTVFHDGAIVRDLRTAGAGETCAAGEDGDGDGLAACDDRDCWVTCTPLCPAAMSCAP